MHPDDRARVLKWSHWAGIVVLVVTAIVTIGRWTEDRAAQQTYPRLDEIELPAGLRMDEVMEMLEEEPEAAPEPADEETAGEEPPAETPGP